MSRPHKPAFFPRTATRRRAIVALTDLFGGKSVDVADLSPLGETFQRLLQEGRWRPTTAKAIDALPALAKQTGKVSEVSGDTAKRAARQKWITQAGFLVDASARKSPVPRTSDALPSGKVKLSSDSLEMVKARKGRKASYKPADKPAEKVKK